MIIYHVFIRN